MTAGQWVLRSSQTYRGRPLWFAQMTGIGPMTTATLAEAARFASREEAALSPALRFPLTSFTPEEVRA